MFQFSINTDLINCRNDVLAAYNYEVKIKFPNCDCILQMRAFKLRAVTEG